MDEGNFSRQSEMRCSDGHTVTVQWAATAERVTDRRLVLFVALSTSRWGAHARRARSSPLGVLPLTARELEVVQLIAHGDTGPEIADELHIAHDTVRAHARNAMLKSGARSRAHLVAKVLGEGLFLGRPAARRKPPEVAEEVPNGEATPEANGGRAVGRAPPNRASAPCGPEVPRPSQRRGPAPPSRFRVIDGPCACVRASEPAAVPCRALGPGRWRRRPYDLSGPASRAAGVPLGGRRRPRLPTISETTVTR